MEIQLIQSKIHDIRGQRVMLDFDLAELYEVFTKALNQAVKRNRVWLPEDFMFQLSLEEWQNLRSQSAISERWSQSVTTSTSLEETPISHMHLQNKALQCYLQYLEVKKLYK